MAIASVLQVSVSITRDRPIRHQVQNRPPRRVTEGHNTRAAKGRLLLVQTGFHRLWITRPDDVETHLPCHINVIAADRQIN